MLQQVLKISNVRKTAPNKNSQRRVHNFFLWIMNFQIKFVEYITQFCIVHNNSWFNMQMKGKFKFVSLPFIVRSFSVTCPFVVRFVRFLYVAFPFCPLLLRYLYGEVRYVSGRSPVLVRYISVQYSSREPRAAAASTFTNGRPTDKGFWQIFHPLDVRSRYPVRCDWAINPPIPPFACI